MLSRWDYVMMNGLDVQIRVYAYVNRHIVEIEHFCTTHCAADTYHIRLLPVTDYISWHVVLQGIVGGILVRELWMIDKKAGCGVPINT